MSNNLWLHLADKTCPPCCVEHLNRRKAFLSKPGVMGHVKWPSVVTLIHSDKEYVQAVCIRPGLIVNDVLPFDYVYNEGLPEEHINCTLSIWHEYWPKATSPNFKLFSIARYMSDESFIRKDLFHVKNVEISHLKGNGQRSQTEDVVKLSFAVKHIIRKESLDELGYPYAYNSVK